MPGGYEFLGLNETLIAFESRDVSQWAIFSGSRFIMKGDGIDTLKEFLAMIARSGTSAIYTLKVYEDLAAGTKINSKTPDDGSFNFKLFDAFGNGGSLSGIIPTHYGNPTQGDMIKKAVREVLEEMTPAETVPETPTILQQVGDALIGMLQEPRKLQEFIGAISGGNAGVPQGAPHIMGSVKTGYASRPSLTDDESLARIGNAVEKIGAVDPDIVMHLEKLADIATTQPGKFKMLLGLLDSGL